MTKFFTSDRVFPRLNFNPILFNTDFFSPIRHLIWKNFAREKWQHEVAKILRGFLFVLF